MSSTAVAVFLIVSVLCVHSLPIDNKPKSSEIVTISKSLLNYLTDINNNTNQSTLFQLYRLADLFTKDELYRPEYQCLERKICMGRVFTYNNDKICGSDSSKSKLTYSELTGYYNEFVLHLKLAEVNLNVSIDLEINETNKNKSLKSEKEIITILKKNILPPLEYILNITRTNCSATKTMADWVISLYSNCTFAQSSNKFLVNTANSLYDILVNRQDRVIITNDDSTFPPPESDKEWCFAL